MLLQEMIKDLPMDVPQHVLVELAVCGVGSINIVRELQVIQNPEAELSTLTMASWCKCVVCVDMGQKEENKCCGRTVCVTLYHTKLTEAHINIVKLRKMRVK